MSISVPPVRVVYSGPFVEVTMDFGQALQRKLEDNFGVYGRVQIFVDEQFQKEIKPYMPFDTNTLRSLMEQQTVIGSGVNIVRAPQASYLYRGILKVDSITGSAWARRGDTKVLTDKALTFHGGGNAGSQWAERWAAANWDSFVAHVQNFIDGKA